MPRIKIEIPATSLSIVEVPVRISDINYGNHVGNDSLVSIIHESRVQWLRGIGLTELNIDGAGLIMRDLAVEFKAEIFYGDILQIELFVDDVTTIAFDLFYQISNNRKALVAKGRTGMLCYDYKAKKVVSIPKSFLKVLEGNVL